MKTQREDVPEDSIASLQEELAASKLREAESNLALKDLRSKVAENNIIDVKVTQGYLCACTYNIPTSAGWGSEHDVVAAHQDAVGVQLRHARGDAQHAEEGD